MNSLFIGLGGAGTNALGELQKKFEEYDLSSRTQSINNYLYIDTDLAIRDKYPFIDANGDFLPFGAGEVPTNIMDMAFKENRADDPNNIRFKEWIDEFNPSLRANHDFSTGAAGERMLTRMITWRQYNTIKTRLNQKLRLATGTAVERIYVISGSCGGTGCGCLMDVLFMLREIQLEMRMVANFPDVNLMLVMPQGYIEVYNPADPRTRNYTLNAYGLLSEINAVLKDRWANVRFKKDASGHFLNQHGNITNNPKEYVEEPNPIIGKQWAKHSVVPPKSSVVDNLHFEPFDRAYFFDSHNESIAQAYDYGIVSERIAEFVFNLEVGNTARTGLDSVFSNVLIVSRIDSARADYVKSFCTTGTFTIQTHEELRKRYVQERFVYQMMTHGFIGKDTDYAIPTNSDTSLWERLNEIITNYTTSSWGIILELYKDDDKGSLYELLKSLETASKQKKPSFVTVFPRLSGNRNSLQNQFPRQCNAIREIVLKRCGEWIVQYNLEYAKEMVDFEDRISQSVFNTDIKEIKKLVPKTKILSSKNGLLDKLKKAFEYYVNVLFNRYLSEDGCFDECRDLLDEVSKSLKFDEFEISPKRRLKEWEHYFIKDVIALQDDPTRKFIPDVSTLIAGGGLSGQCDFSTKYESIITQVDGTNLPDMELSIDPITGLITTTVNTLPWYKERILREISRDIPNFCDYFRPDNLKREPGYVFAHFLNYTKKEAMKVVHDLNNGLAEPIAMYINTPEMVTETAQELYQSDSIFFSSNHDQTIHPLRAIYLGHFASERGEASQLERAIRSRQGFNQAEHIIQDDPHDYWNDRYVKVMAQMNYDISDYSFFEGYKDFFDEYYEDHKEDYSRHMPFSSKVFWENPNIVDLFNKGAEETLVEELKKSLIWNNSEQVYAFDFMAVLLNEFYERLSKLPDSKKFIKKFQAKTKGKTTIKPIFRDKNNVTITYYSDFIHNPLQDKYFIDDEGGVIKVNLAAKITPKVVGDVKDIYNRYIQFWITVIKKALSMQAISDENTLYKNAYQMVYEIAKKGGHQELFEKLIAPYYNAQSGNKGERDFFEEYLLWFSK